MDKGAWWATVHGSQRVGHDWATSLHFTSLSLYPLESLHFHHDIASFCSYFEPDGFGLSRDFCIMDHHFFSIGSIEQLIKMVT